MKKPIFILTKEARTGQPEWVLTRYGAGWGLALVSIASGILALIAGAL